MVLTTSAPVALGTHAPHFSLPDANGRVVSLEDFAGAKGVLVVFWCNHCQYVRHIKSGFAEFALEYQAQGIAVVAINANDTTAYPADGPDRMLEDIADFGYTFDYLLDDSQETAKAYGAACTPDFYLFDSELSLVYHGQFDGSRPRNEIPVDGRDLRAAADAVLAHRRPAPTQTPSIGCNIKWKA